MTMWTHSTKNLLLEPHPLTVPAAGDGVPKQSDEGALEDRTQELVGVAQQVAWLVIKCVARGVQLF